MTPELNTNPEEQAISMSIRAEFAKAAMQGLLAASNVTTFLSDYDIPALAVRMADDTIAELNKEKK